MEKQLKEFTSQDMIDFVRYYDNKFEQDCHRTFEEELNEWINKTKLKVCGEPCNDFKTACNKCLNDYFEWKSQQIKELTSKAT